MGHFQLFGTVHLTDLDSKLLFHTLHTTLCLLSEYYVLKVTENVLIQETQATLLHVGTQQFCEGQNNKNRMFLVMYSHGFLFLWNKLLTTTKSTRHQDTMLFERVDPYSHYFLNYYSFLKYFLHVVPHNLF